jgi:hypothetical protein
VNEYHFRVTGTAFGALIKTGGGNSNQGGDMFGTNGHEPILSQMEIRFLLSDQPLPVKPPLRPTGKKARDKTRTRKKDATVDNHFAAPVSPADQA